MPKTCLHTSIPPYMLGAMQRYLDHRIAPGGFLTAVLENKLVDAFSRADENNLKAMHELAAHLYWCLPSLCWGSPEKVKEWLATKEESHA